MSREYCNICKRAQRGCICCFTTIVSNKNLITILRHPSEVKNIKGTAQLLNLSLDKVSLCDGEKFNPENILSKDYENILVFPSEKALEINGHLNSKDNLKLKNFIFIDGTWKKAYKILQLNPFLKELPHIKLNSSFESTYAQIRKQRNGGYSTLESVVAVLSIFEKGNQSLTELKESYSCFISQLKRISSSPEKELEKS